LLGHLQFLTTDLRADVDAAEVSLADLVRPVHGLEHEGLILESERGEVLLVPETDLGDPHATVIGHGLSQQA
jgi:hypothetical protein